MMWWLMFAEFWATTRPDACTRSTDMRSLLDNGLGRGCVGYLEDCAQTGRGRSIRSEVAQ